MRALILLLLATAALAEPPEPKFRAVTLDDKVQIGYGVTTADVDGDGHPDILLADKKQFVWYRNPGGAGIAEPGNWRKFILAENLTAQDNVCIAAQDIDGDGKCEIAVGAEWNPGDTEKSGAVFYLIAPADRTQPWEPVKFPSVEPTTHRMRWIKFKKEWGLLVVPLHGRGNKNGEGTPVKVLVYQKPAGDPHEEWKGEVIDESMHMTHNFDVITNVLEANDGILLTGKEDFGCPSAQDGSRSLIKNSSIEGFKGAGEIRLGELYLASIGISQGYIATVEPMHGNQLVFYSLGDYRDKLVHRRILTDKLTEGHALACGDFLGTGGDQIVVGWRGTPGKADSTTGVAVWTPLDPQGEKWRETVIDPTNMACEDLQLADLNGDGKLDIVASGRATKNVKIYFNETPR